MRSSDLIMSDSGGVVEEATSPPIRKRVLVLRLSTERVEAVRAGFATVVGTKKDSVLRAVARVLRSGRKLPRTSPYGRGDTAERIADILGSEMA
jgi:UDP-N-acetylglucosamine 2-epimerase (non-hydrolysing)